MIRRSTSTLTLLALLGAFTPGLGCLVSFDGYKPLGDTTDGGEGGSLGGSSTAGKGGGSAGKGSAGKAGSGNDGGRAGRSSGGASGSANTGGTTALTGGKGGSGGEGNESGEAGAAATGGGETGGSAGASGSTSGGSSGRAGEVGGAAGSATGGAGNGGTSGLGGSSGLGGGGTGGSGGVESCPVGLPGPALIEVPLPDGFFCIDRTEVTNTHYAAFLASSPNTGAQSASCGWNTTFAPESSSACDPLPYDPSARPNNPVSCVDWCDARAFCEWAGKELCGRIDGGENPTADFDDAEQSAWYRSCTGGGTKSLPYGNDYEGSACVGLDFGVVRAQNVASVAQCQGGYDGLWDMSGNVSEWEDSCDGAAGATGRCAHRGGSWLTPGEAALYCNSSLPSDTTPNPVLTRRDTRDEHIGFRCCYRP